MHNKEIRDRIRLAVAAYGYEIADHPTMTDAAYDAMAERIDPSKPTNNLVIDWFFWKNFDPHTGIWIYRHPDLAKVAHCYQAYACALR